MASIREVRSWSTFAANQTKDMGRSIHFAEGTLLVLADQEAKVLRTFSRLQSFE
jgi:hypothetical protein